MNYAQNNRLIYEVEEEEDQRQMLNSKQMPPSKIDRKLGAVSYLKWGTLYNYTFSFNLKRGRLLCYKTWNSNNYNNYYTLNKGGFLEDESEISKFEAQLKKKKNYQDVENNKNTIYVKTAKGRVFKLIVSENENFDKIIGYLQMCFSSKIDHAKAFFAMLGVGLIQIKDHVFKLTTGIYVSLDDWSQSTNQNNYLSKADNQPNGFNLLISNIGILGGCISSLAGTHQILGIIFNPQLQTIDVIVFDETTQQPNQIYIAIFKLIKARKLQPSGRSQLLKLNTNVQVHDDKGDYLQVAQNENVKIFLKKQFLKIADYELIQGGMVQSKYIEDQNELEEDKGYVSSCLEFYKRQQQQIKSDDTREFIIVRRHINYIDRSPQKKRMSFSHIEDIGEEICKVQMAKSINVHMGKYKTGSSGQFDECTPKYQSAFPFKNSENSSPISDQYNVQSDILQGRQQREEINDFVLDQQREQQNMQFEYPSDQQNDDQYQQIDDQQIDDQQINFQDQQMNDQQQDDDEEINLVKVSIVFDEEEHCKYRDNASIIKYASEFNGIDKKDEHRIATAHKKGGMACLDQKMVELTRNVGQDMIKQVGRKLLGGNFNLTTISFPIKAMIPKSALEKTFMQTILFPLYMNKAAMSTSFVERIKLTMTAILCNYVQANSFLKPLNPILGETFEGGYEDGTLLYCEQITHHPPVSYFNVYGPKNSYKMHGYSVYEAKAGLNSLTIINNGKRWVQFQDQKLLLNFSSEHYSGTFFGTLKHESQGILTLLDEANDYSCNVRIGKVSNRPSDYFEGEIKRGKGVLCKIYGSYMGFMDIDGVRYWDARTIKPFAMQILKTQLPSDHLQRTDRILMLEGDMNKAQIEKERLEAVQRNDALLRKSNAKLIAGSNKKPKK